MRYRSIGKRHASVTLGCNSYAGVTLDAHEKAPGLIPGLFRC
jgi:hypothetical protein